MLPIPKDFARNNAEGEYLRLCRPTLAAMNFWRAEIDSTVAGDVIRQVNEFPAFAQDLAFPNVRDQELELVRKFRVVREKLISHQDVVEVQIAVEDFVFMQRRDAGADGSESGDRFVPRFEKGHAFVPQWEELCEAVLRGTFENEE
jgi:hypothetical protein